MKNNQLSMNFIIASKIGDYYPAFFPYSKIKELSKSKKYMRADTSKQPENSSSQLIRKIAEGKRNGESHREALSLQDVFSDSGNASGRLQKTSRPFEIEQGKGAQLGKDRGEL